MVDGRDSAWRNRAPGPHRNTARQAMDSLWTEVCGQQTQSNDPRNNQHNPQYANDWAPLTRKRHIPPHPAQPQHTSHWAPRTRKRHQQEHRPQRPTERSDPTQHAKGRTGDCPGPRKGTTTRRNVTTGGGRTAAPAASSPPQTPPRSDASHPQCFPPPPWPTRGAAVQEALSQAEQRLLQLGKDEDREQQLHTAHEQCEKVRPPLPRALLLSPPSGPSPHPREGVQGGVPVMY